MSTNRRRNEICRSQNDLLYKGVGYSTIGSVLAGAVALLVFGPLTGYASATVWFVLLCLVYASRALDLWAYTRARRTDDSPDRVDEWGARVHVGALAASITWASSLWFLYPPDQAAHATLLILMLGGVAGGALATLPYDVRLNTRFQLIILASVQVRLWAEVVGGGGWTDQTLYHVELAAFSAFVFGFLIVCGKGVGRNYSSLLSLRYDVQETNVTQLRNAEDMANLGYWQWHIGSPEIAMSEKLGELTGLAQPTARVAVCYRLIHRDDMQRVRQGFSETIASEKPVSFEYRIRSVGASEYRYMRQVIKSEIDSHGKPMLIGTVQDVSDIKDAADRIHRLAYYDDLTGLENRARFHEHLEHHCRVAKGSIDSMAVIYIDLDDFRSVNDCFGHEHADDYLRLVAGHLLRSVRRSDHVARIGGDEFAVLLHDVVDAQVIHETVRRLLDVTRSTVQIGPHRIQPKLSAGMAVFPNDGHDPELLVKRATIAMRHAKRSEEGEVSRYSERMGAENLERAQLESDLRHALATDQFELHYQPKIDIGTNRMTGAEALIRWRHPERGLVPPGLFIELAERVGMIAELGDWVLRTACAQQAIWRAEGLKFRVSINISGDHFVQPGFVARVSEVLKENALSPGDLEIEITESLSRNPKEHGQVCKRLRQLGVAIAIDDFGTGFSSLSVLADLEIDTIKIDRSFVIGLPGSDTARLMVDTIIALSKGLGYDIIAEGVETCEQLECLRAAGCSNIQGFYFSRPVEAEKVPKLALDHWSHSRAA